MKLLLTILLLPLLSFAQSRDMEADFNTLYGTTFTRVSGDSALFCSVFEESADGLITIGQVKHLTKEQVLPEEFSEKIILYSSTLTALIPDYKKGEGIITFGNSGMSVYVCYNGKEVLRFKTFIQCVPGNILMRGNRNYYVINYATRALPTAHLYSKKKVLDARDIDLLDVLKYNASGYTYKYPSKTFKYSGNVLIQYQNNFTIEGSANTILYVPDGFSFWNNDGLTIKNLTFKGNNDKANITVGNVALRLQICSNVTLSNLKFINPVTSVLLQYCTNVYGQGLYINSKMGNHSYLQWGIQGVESKNIFIKDVVFVSGKLVEAFEFFKCDSGRFENITSTNGVMAMNGSQRFHVKNAKFTILPNSQPIDKHVSAGTSVINVNTNAGSDVQAGGTLENVVINVGYINKEKDLLQGIIVNGNNPNVKIIGGSYDSETPVTKWQGAIITAGKTSIKGFKTKQEIRVEN